MTVVTKKWGWWIYKDGTVGFGRRRFFTTKECRSLKVWMLEVAPNKAGAKDNLNLYLPVMPKVLWPSRV